MTPHPELEQLSVYLDGELSEREQVPLEAHVAGCTDCSRTLKALRATLTDLGTLDEPTLDEQTSWSIRSAVARERKLSSRSRRWSWAAGAAAASIIGIVVFLMSTGGDRIAARDTNAPAGALEAARVDVLASDYDYSESSLQTALGAIVVERTVSMQKQARTADQYDASAGSAGGGSGTTANSGAAASTPSGSTQPVPMPAPAVAAPVQPFPAALRAADDPARAQALNCLDILQKTPPRVNVLQVIAARFKKEKVFVYFFEAPADKPRRVELWVVTRSGCDVRYFRQAKLPPA